MSAIHSCPSNAATVAATATTKSSLTFPLMLLPAIVSPLAACPSAYRVRWARRWQRYGAQLVPQPDIHLRFRHELPVVRGPHRRQVLDALGGDIPKAEEPRRPCVPHFVAVMIR